MLNLYVSLDQLFKCTIICERIQKKEISEQTSLIVQQLFKTINMLDTYTVSMEYRKSFTSMYIIGCTWLSVGYVSILESVFHIKILVIKVVIQHGEPPIYAWFWWLCDGTWLLNLWGGQTFVEDIEVTFKWMEWQTLTFYDFISVWTSFFNFCCRYSTLVYLVGTL